MKYNILIMLLSVLCLFGCSSESEPQSVAFEFNEYRFDKNGGQVTVNVIANCSWTIGGIGKGLNVGLRSGEGNLPLHINIERNESYDELHYTLTVTSEDGTSTSTMNIYQDMSYGLLVGDLKDMIPAEGCTFYLPISTNEENVQIETPDWVTYTSARGLTDYKYSFKAEPNQTGKPRKGDVFIKASSGQKNVTVNQDSFSPESVQLLQDISWVTEHQLSVPMSITPKYGDLSKLDVKTSSNVKLSSIEEDNLHFQFQEYGKFDIRFNAGEKEIGHADGEFLPKHPFNTGTEKELYIGQELYIDYWYYSPDYILTSSSEDVIKVLNNRNILAKGLGEAKVSAIHPYAGEKSEMSIKVEPFTLEARIGWINQKGGGIFDVSFSALIKGPSDMTNIWFMVIDKDNRVVIYNEGNIGEKGVINTKAISVSRIGYNNSLDALDGYVFMASAIVDGMTYNKYVNINTHYVAPY